jgi:5-methylcytosine-specific restriction protein A
MQRNRRPRRPCRQPGCSALVERGYCDRHQRPAHVQYDARRGSAAARGYGRTWQRLRRMILARDPVCRCTLEGCTHAPGRCLRWSEHVDHIVPKARGGDDAEDNMQGLCAGCNSRKTVLEDGGFGLAPAD